MVYDTVEANLAAAKQSDTQYPIEPVLQQRWSPLAFSGRPVESEKLCQVLEAARWAASSYNEQPWSFIVAPQEQPAEFEQMLSCLAEGNQEWAKQAPVLMLAVAKLKFERNQTDNPHAFHDVGAAEANLAIQATALGLSIHQMAGFDAAKARELYGIPAGYEPVDAIALGYLGDPAVLSERLQERERTPRTRKPLSSFVFSGGWDQKAAFV